MSRTNLLMQALAEGINQGLNGGSNQEGDGAPIGFTLLVYNHGELEGGRVNYVSNSERDTVKTALKELLARWEGQPSIRGAKQ